MDIASMISVFETISDSFGGLDPEAFINFPKGSGEEIKKKAEEFIKNCLVEQMKRNTGLTDKDIEYIKKLEELDKQAAAMIEDPDSGEKLKEDIKNKLKDAASGAENAYNNMKQMPNKIKKLAVEAYNNFSSISSNPMTINCLPSAVLSFVQSLKSIKSELTIVTSTAVNFLKQLDDLGVTSIFGTISTQDYDDVIDAINTGMASCPESIKLDYNNTTSIFIASSVSFPNLDKDYINNSVFRSYLNLDECVSTKANDSDIFCSSITLYYDTDKIDNLVKQGDIYDSLKNRHSSYELYPLIYYIFPTRIIIDRKSNDTITTRILCTTVKSNDQAILPISSSQTHGHPYTDEMGYYDIYVDLYKYDQSSSSLSEYRMIIIPRASKYQNITNRSYLLYNGSRVAGIYIMYDGDYITVNSDLMMTNSTDTLLELDGTDDSTNVTWRKFYRSKISDNCIYESSKITYNNIIGYLSSYHDTVYSTTTLIDTTITNTKIDRNITTSISTQYLKVSDTSYLVWTYITGHAIYYKYYSIINSEFGDDINHNMIRTDSFYITNSSEARTNSYKIDMTINSNRFIPEYVYKASVLSSTEITYPGDDSINNMTPNDLPWSNISDINISDSNNQLTDFHVKCSWYKMHNAYGTTMYLIPKIDIIYFNIREGVDLSKVNTKLSINGSDTTDTTNVLHIKYNESDLDLRLGDE